MSQEEYRAAACAAVTGWVSHGRSRSQVWMSACVRARFCVR